MLQPTPQPHRRFRHANSRPSFKLDSRRFEKERERESSHFSVQQSMMMMMLAKRRLLHSGAAINHRQLPLLGRRPRAARADHQTGAAVTNDRSSRLRVPCGAAANRSPNECLCLLPPSSSPLSSSSLMMMARIGALICSTGSQTGSLLLRITQLI